MSTPEIEAVLAQLRKLLEAEYARGEKNAIARIVQAASKSGDVESAPANGHAHTAPRKRARIQKRHRAEPGTADTLIKRVLAERRIKGAGAQEIMEAANTTAERAVSYSGVRFALDRGRLTGIYRNKDGKWYLTGQQSEG
jgi:hypothetical protein